MTHRILRRLLRALAITALVVGIPSATAAGVSYLLLAGTEWDTPTPETTVPAVPPTSTATPAPDDNGRGPETRWALGDCYTPTLAPIACTRPGALRIVGVIHQPQNAPCAGLALATRDIRTGDYALCLEPES